MARATSSSRSTGEVTTTSPVLFAALFSALLATACASTVLPPSVLNRAPPSSTAAVATLAELTRAFSAGGASEVRRVLAERWGAAALVGEGVVAHGPGAGAAVPLLLIVRLGDLRACDTAQAGFVVDEPARLVGCGAQDLSALAAFVLAAEGNADVALVVGDDDDDIIGASPAAARVWTGGGLMVQGTAVDVFDLDAVDGGGFDVELSRPDASATALAVSVGRAASWASPLTTTRVIAERWRRVPHPWWESATTTYAASPSTSRLVRERCDVVALTPAVARLWCNVLPGHDVVDVADDIIRAVDDPGTALRIVEPRPATATGFDDLLVRVLEARLAEEGSRIVVAPAVQTSSTAAVCSAFRRRDVPCVGGVPLLVHPVERERAGGEDEAVDVVALTAMVGRVLDVVDTIVGSESARPPP